MVSESIELFFSYSHKDEELREKLEEHLAGLKREGVIKSWYDRQIEAGTEWARQIDARLATSDIILLLISASFINSDYCWGIELEQSMKRHEAGEACVIPVILRPVSWKNAPFGKLQAFPKDAKPVETWNNLNEAFVSVTEGIRIAAENLLKQRQQKLRQQEISRIQYLKKVEEVLSNGRISLLGRDTLEEHRKELGLTPEEASVIENNAFEPYKRYEENLNKYKQSLLNVIQHEYPFSDETKAELKLRQRDLGLKSEDIERIEQLILTQAEADLGLKEDKTVPRPLTPPKPETPDATIVRPLAPPKPEILKTTIAQIYPDSTQGSDNGQTKKNIDLIEPTAAKKYNFKPTLAVDEPQRGGNQKKVRRLLATTTVVVAVVSMGFGYYYYTKGQTDQSEKTALETIQLLKTGKNYEEYEECVNQAKAVPQTSPFYADAQNLLNECQSLVHGAKLLAKAKELVQENNLKDAISEASKIQPYSSYFQSAQQLINQCSLNLIKQAEDLYKQSYNSKSLENAIGITKAIPKTSSVAKNAEKMTENWRIEWNKNENYLQAAQNALKQDKWQEAIDKTNKVRLLGQKVKQNTPYWQNKMKPIIEMAQKRIAASKIQGSGTNNALQLKLPSSYSPPPEPIPSSVSYPPRSTVQSQPKSPVLYLSKPRVQPQPKSPVPYLSRSPVQSQPKPRSPMSTPPPLAPAAQRILCQQFPLNSRCGSNR